MNHNAPKHLRILAVALSTRGFGFAVMEGEKTIIECGAKAVIGDKNARSLVKIGKLVEFYRPDVIVLQDMMANGSRRAPRIKSLNHQIIEAVKKRKIKVTLVSPKQVRTLLLGDEKGTKQGIAETLAKEFPNELASRLPPKRRPWTSEDCRMDIFDAMALAVAFRSRLRSN